MEKEYRKSYKGFVIWLIVFSLSLFGVAFLPVEDGALIGRAICLLTLVGLQTLMLIIVRTERVYWFNGVSYEEAEAAGSERRRAFAWAHFKRFGWCTLLGAACILLAQLMGWPIWIDLALTFVALMTAAFSTLRIKL